MKMKNTIVKTLCISGILTLFFTSCYEDLGNYNYSEINEIEVDTFRLAYEVVQFDTLTIKPIISETLHADVMTYEWEVDKKVVSHEKDLAYRVEFVKSEVPIRFKVTNESTGVSYFQYSQLNSTGYFSSGLSLLHEVNGHYSSAFIRMAPDNPGLVVDSMFIRNGFDMGHAFSVHSTFYKDNLGTGYFMVCDTALNGERRITMFDVEMSQINQIKRKFVVQKIIEYDARFQLILGYGGGINHIHTRQDDAIYGNISYPYDVSSFVCPIKLPHPFNPANSLSALVYMEKGSGLNTIKFGRPWTTSIYPGFGAMIFTPSTTQLVAGVEVDNTFQYLLVADQANGSGTVYRTKVSLFGGVMVQSQIDVPEGTFLHNSKYHVSGKRGCFFYTNGNSLFKAKCDDEMNATEFFTAKPGADISCVYGTDSEDVLYVSVYDPSAGETYKGSLYVISQEDGSVVDQYENKTGRVIDMDYKKYSKEQVAYYHSMN